VWCSKCWERGGGGGSEMDVIRVRTSTYE
jgi:hypothetical protein